MNMNFDVIKSELIKHVNGMFVPFNYHMFEAVESLDIDRLNAEIIRVHSAEVAEWERCLATQPHSPEGSCHPYAWVMDAQAFLASEPPVFDIPKSWGASALQVWSRYQAHKHKTAMAA